MKNLKLLVAATVALCACAVLEGASAPTMKVKLAESAGVGAVANTAAIPWVMAKDYRDNEAAIQDYFKKLGVQKNEDVVALDKQLRARAETDRGIVKAGGGKYGKLKYHAVGGGQYFVED